MRKISVPRDDPRVDEIVTDPKRYFAEAREQAVARAEAEVDRRTARRFKIGFGRFRDLKGKD